MSRSALAFRRPPSERRSALRRPAPRVGLSLALLLAATRAGAQPSGAPPSGPPPVPVRAGGDEVLLGRRVRSGGYGGPELRVSRLAGRTALLVGGRGGWVVNRHFVLGVGGFGSATTGVRTGWRLPSGREARLAMGYGGVDLGWVTRPARLVHLTANVLVGAGGATYGDGRAGDAAPDRAERPSDAFAVLEPGLAAELNVTPHLRVAAGASYRQVSGLRLPTLRAADLGGAAGTVIVKFGRF